MPVYKNTSDDYIITVDGGTGTLVINADLDVVGNITYVTSNILIVEDPFITVAGNNTGTVTTMGLVGQLTSSTFAGLRFNTVTSTWQVSASVLANGDPVTAYATIQSGADTAAGSNTEVQFNNSGAFAANAALKFDFTNSRLTLAGHQTFSNIATTPSVVANSITIYNKVLGAGGTGLYAVGTGVDDELVSKTKAIVFGIIF